MVQRAVKGVFLFEEHGVQGVFAFVAVVQRANVAARTKGFFASAAQYHGLDVGIVDPGIELLLQAADHGQVEGVEAAGAVEGQVANMVADLGQYRALGRLDILCRRG